jgi:hypothetical protein
MNDSKNNRRTFATNVARQVVSLLIAPAILMFTLAATAQVERATITGTVTDANGGVLPDATVKVTEESTNVATTLQTDSAGRYTASNLTPGSYTVQVEKAGFQSHVNKGFVIQVFQTARLDVLMSVGSVEQTVEVTTSVPLLQNENASVGQVITTTAIDQLPLNGRNMSQLAIIAPGVTGLNYAQSGTIGAGARPDELRPGGTTIEANGARDGANKLLLDGIDNTEMIAQTFVVRPSVDGLQEFAVLTSGVGAQFDRGMGAIVVTSTRSGSNEFHGSGYEYIRNSSVDAKNYFVSPGAPNPAYRLNDLGGRLGGPILRKKTFFFVNYEGYFERAASTLVTTVPTLAERQGNFQGVAHVYDPLTTTASGSTFTRTEFPNDTIPANRFDPIAFQLVNAYPQPQNAALANNYTAYPLKSSNDNRGDVRIDHQISSTQTLFGRYSLDDTQIQMPNTFNDVIGGNENSFSGHQADRGQQGVIAYTKVLPRNMVAEYRFGFNRYTSFLIAPKLSSPIFAQIPGNLPNPGFQPVAAGAPANSAPIISPSGFGGIGSSRGEPQIRRERMMENVGNVSWLRGAHSLKFGVDIIQHMISETDTPPGQSGWGRFNFDGNFTNNPASPTGTGNTMASMLLGFPTQTAKDYFIPGTAHILSNEYNMYGQDDWRVTHKLTLNLGVHYEIDTPYHEAHNFMVNFDRVTGAVQLAGQNGVSKSANWETDYGSVGPRVGFAYSFNNKTVLRGGYGVFFDPQTQAGTTIRQQRQWPFDLIYVVTPGSLFPQNTVSQGFVTPAQIPPSVLASPYGTLKGIQPDFKNASGQEFNLAIQTQLGDRSSFTLGYVGSIGRHLTWTYPLNQPSPGPGNIQARRPFNAMYPNVTSISYLESVGTSDYNSMQTSFQQRLTHGFFLTANYVWSHAFDNSPFDGGADGPVPQDPTNRNADWASSDNDIRSRMNIYGTYELPFGPGKTFLNGKSILNRIILGGWQVNGIFAGQSGLPFTVTTSGTATNTGASSSRANVVAGVPQYPTAKSVRQWFNPAAFSVPTAFNWGNSGRNILRGPHEINVDASAEKKFPIREGTNVLIRIEAFNMLNHPQFQIPASVIAQGGVGSITATSNTARQLQGTLRITF